MLWCSDDVPHVLILGSIHFLEKGALPDWVLRVHQQADAVVFEANLRKKQPPPTLPSDLSIPSLAPELWQLVESTARNFGFGAEKVHDLSNQYPFTISGKIANWALQRAGASFEQGLDAVLTERTSDPLDLETFPEYYRLVFQTPPLPEQVASLRLFLESLDELPERFLRASENWKIGNPEAVLDALGFSRNFSGFPGIAAGMFANRHSLWLPRAGYYIQRAAELGHQLLIVVGCSHLAGPQTFLADLEKHYGYKFRRA